MSIVRISVNRSVSVTMLMLALTLVGFGALFSLNIELFPNIDIPLAFIQTPYPGVDPAEMENIVTRKIEEEINTVENIKKITSFSFEGFSHITVEFRWGTDLDLASVDLREKVDLAKRGLPRDIEQVTVAKLDINAQPLLQVALGGDYDLKRLRTIADKEIKPAFERLMGVANVEVFGGLEREIRVKVSPEKLRAMRLTIDDVITALSKDNQNTPVGNITEGNFKYLIRSEGEVKTPQALGNIILKNISGRPVYLSEVATIHDSFKDLVSIARLNGKPAVTLQVKKEAGANPVEISDAANKLIPQLEEKYQGKLSITIAKDESHFIRDSINMVKENATTGALIAIVVLFFFLKNYRSTLIIGLSIPLAVVMTFAIMYLKHGMTLNLMTLGGLALGIGMMVDNSVVVLENIFRYMTGRDAGNRVENSIIASEEVMMPIVASTLTTVAVFLPIAFVPGIVGQIFINMSLAIVFSLSASLLVAITLVPMMSSKILRLDSPFLEEIILSMSVSFVSWCVKNWVKTILSIFAYLSMLAVSFLFLGDVNLSAGVLEKMPFLIGLKYFHVFLIFLLTPLLPVLAWIILRLFTLLTFQCIFHVFDFFFFAVFHSLYVAFLGFLLRRTWRRMVFVIFVGGIFYFSLSYLPELTFFPEMDRGEFVIAFEMPEGTSVEKTDSITRQMEEILKTVPEAEKVIISSSLGEGNLSVVLTPKATRTLTTNQIIARIRPEIEKIPGYLTLAFKEPKMGGPGGGKAVQIEVTGSDFNVIESICRDVAARIKDIKGLKDLEDGVKEGRPEIKMEFDREKIRDLGVNLATVAGMARSFVFGTLAGKFKEQNEEYDIRVEAEDRYKDEIDKLRTLEMPVDEDKFVLLSQIARIFEGKGYSRIERQNLKRTIKVQADLQDRPLGAVMKDVQERLKGMEVPSGYAINFGGENEEMMESFANLGIALISSILLVYMIMASQFESFLYPFIILFTIPLSLIGVIIGLNVGGFAFSITAMIGLIMLAGIAVNNGIILIEYINQRRETENEGKIEAAINSGSIRYRPIMMTVMTTVLGMSPLALGIGAGSDFYQPLALAVMGGLTVSTLLTLAFIPTLYLLIDDVKEKLIRFFGKFI